MRSDSGRALSRPQPLGVDDSEVSGTGVYEGVCEAPTFTEWTTMIVPTYAEDGMHALKVYQRHHQVVRVAHIVSLSELRVQVARDCVGQFGRNLSVRQHALRSVSP